MARRSRATNMISPPDIGWRRRGSMGILKPPIVSRLPLYITSMMQLKERTMTEETNLTNEGRRNFIGVAAAVGGIGTLLGSSVAPAQTSPPKQYIKREASQRSGYSQAVITQGGRTIWLAGHTADTQANPSLI